MVLAEVFFVRDAHAPGEPTQEASTLAFAICLKYGPYFSEGGRVGGSLLTALETAHMIGKGTPSAVSQEDNAHVGLNAIRSVEHFWCASRYKFVRAARIERRCSRWGSHCPQHPSPWLLWPS